MAAAESLEAETIPPAAAVREQLRFAAPKQTQFLGEKLTDRLNRIGSSSRHSRFQQWHRVGLCDHAPERVETAGSSFASNAEAARATSAGADGPS